MRSLLLLATLLSTSGLSAQNNWVKVFSDGVQLNSISTNGRIIATVGQNAWPRVGLKTLSWEGDLLGENSSPLSYKDLYEDVIVFNDSTVIAAGRKYDNGEITGGGVVQSEFCVFNAQAARKSRHDLLASPNAACITRIARVAEDRLVASSIGTLGLYQWQVEGSLMELNHVTFGTYPHRDYNFLEIWQDSLAILVSNSQDSIMLRQFTGESVERIRIDWDVTATLLLGDTLWLTTTTDIYRLILPEMNLEHIDALPMELPNVGLQWIPEQTKILLSQLKNRGGSRIWHFDPQDMTWDSITHAVIPQGQLNDLKYHEGNYVFCGVLTDDLGLKNSFVGKSDSLIINLPVLAGDVGIKVVLSVLDTALGECFYPLGITTWEAEVNITNYGTEAVSGISWQSDPFRRYYCPWESTYHSLSGIVLETLSPGQTISTIATFTEMDQLDSIESWVFEAYYPYELCFSISIGGYWTDQNPDNNDYCATGQLELAEPEVIGNVLLYPNPVAHTLHINATPEAIEEWTIIGPLGNIMASATLAMPVETLEITLPDLHPGHYWIGLQTDLGLHWHAFFAE